METIQMDKVFNNALVNEMYSKTDKEFWNYYTRTWEGAAGGYHRAATRAKKRFDQSENDISEQNWAYLKIKECERNIDELQDMIHEVDFSLLLCVDDSYDDYPFYSMVNCVEQIDKLASEIWEMSDEVGHSDNIEFVDER